MPAQIYSGDRRFNLPPNGLRCVIRTVRKLGLSWSCARRIEAPGVLAKREALLTFDDGCVDFLEHALPVLEEEQCPATLFVVPGLYRQHRARLPTDIPDTYLLSPGQLEEACRHPGITLASHSLTHPRLTTLSGKQLTDQLEQSDQLLRADFRDRYLAWLAYPFGNFNDQVLEAASRSPYRFAFTLERGIWDDQTAPHRVPRFALSSRDGMPLVFGLKLLRNRFHFGI